MTTSPLELVPASQPEVAERHTVNAVLPLVEATLDELSRQWEVLASAVVPRPGVLHTDSILSLVRGFAATTGKLLRPRMAHWGWVAAGGLDHGRGHDDLIRIGAALELLHCFALVHDDVMDASDTRRGRPATHRAGLEAMIQGLEGWRRTNFIAWQCLFEAMVIEELVKAGRLADAMRYLVPLKARLAATGEAQFLVPALLAEARCLAAQNQGRPALECLDRAATHADNAGACLWQQRTWQVRDDLAGSGA